MTIKEITELRKSGHLDKALEAATNEFDQNANVYTAGALFWCLNDLSKLQTGDEAKATVKRMQAMFENYGANNEFLQRAISAAIRRILPHFEDLKNAIENAKNESNIIAVHNQFTELYNCGELDESLYSDFGWLTYYALKQTELSDTQKRKVLLSQYLKLNLSRPSILHSLILSEAIDIEKSTPLLFRIRDFVRLWGLENLRKEDWEQFHTDEGNTMSSLVEKLITVYTKELKTDRAEASEDFSQMVDKALGKYPQNQNMPYYKANVLISQGKMEEALTYYKDLILKSPSKFYLWSQAAELVEDIDIKIGLLCKALSCGAEDKFLGKIILRLASYLMQKGLVPNAKYELDKFRKIYQSNSWGLKSDFWDLYNQIASAEATVNNNSVYAEFSAIAEKFIYSSLTTVVALKVAESQMDDRNHINRKILVWTLRTRDTVVRLKKPTKFGLNKRTPNGAVFDIKLQGDRIVWITPHTGPINEPWLKEHIGEVRIRTDRKGNNYTIISGSYVGYKLLKDVSDGQQLKVLSILQENGRWYAIAKLKN